MQAMFGALRAMNPDIPEPQSDIKSLENPEVIIEELSAAGFTDTRVHLVTKHFPVTSLREFWLGMVKGSAPIVMMKNSMQAEEWVEKEKIAINFLEQTFAPMPESFSSDAWIGCGLKV